MGGINRRAGRTYGPPKSDRAPTIGKRALRYLSDGDASRSDKRILAKYGESFEATLEQLATLARDPETAPALNEWAREVLKASTFPPPRPR